MAEPAREIRSERRSDDEHESRAVEEPRASPSTETRVADQSAGNAAVKRMASGSEREDEAKHDAASGQEDESKRDHKIDRVPTDVLYEQLAHGQAYLSVRPDPDSKESRWLRAQGYQVGGVYDGEFGLALRVFTPLRGEHRPPVVAFRGTQDAKDVKEDLGTRGIGSFQFSANEGAIALHLAAATKWGPVVATGHSLGGALAQMATAMYPDLIAHVVTFQSPGIPQGMVDRLKAHNDAAAAGAGGKQVLATHYRVQQDLVSTAGDAWTPGEVVEFTIAPSTLSALTGMFQNLGTAQGHTAYTATAEYLKLNPKAAADMPEVGKKPGDMKVAGTHDADRDHGANEWVRSGAGSIASTFMAGQARRERYVDLWRDVRNLLAAGATVAEVEAIIAEKAPTVADAKRMKENLEQIVAAIAYAHRAQTPPA